MQDSAVLTSVSGFDVASLEAAVAGTGSEGTMADCSERYVVDVGTEDSGCN